jgi:glycine cleavage system H protein
MQLPDDLRYSSDHEWVRLENGQLRLGITDYAQDALGDVVFVEIPEVGMQVDAAAKVSEVESTKSVSDIYAPVAGTVIAVNESLADSP